MALTCSSSFHIRAIVTVLSVSRQSVSDVSTSYMLLVAVRTPFSHIKPSNHSQHFSTVMILAAMFIYQTRKKKSFGMGACVAFYKQKIL